MCVSMWYGVAVGHACARTTTTPAMTMAKVFECSVCWQARNTLSHPRPFWSVDRRSHPTRLSVFLSSSICRSHLAPLASLLLLLLQLLPPPLPRSLSV